MGQTQRADPIFTGVHSDSLQGQHWIHSVPNSELHVYKDEEQGDHFLAFKNPQVHEGAPRVSGTVGIHAVYPSRKFVSPKLRLLTDFLVEAFADPSWNQMVSARLFLVAGQCDPSRTVYLRKPKE